ncbi:hypothetical protein FM101_05150 [Arthrobacter rhombi]|uniref:Metallo-beta-lactamase domain-containing protein n=1 Tax=Arthrobacter rhombi TaxID=71253 RepID=A0A1R4FPW6_9MICC|nr:hypothetical protein FM101_05150 [Arthrobacter rhombi]
MAVGDGACSVAYADAPSDDLVMDCGAGTNPAATAPADKLLEELVSRKQRQWLPQELLVTHFDADHWGGLARLPIQAQAYKLQGHSLGLKGPKRVTIFYPRFPRPAAPLGVAMVAHALIGTALQGGPFFDLVSAWKKAGAKVTLIPLCRGDSFCGPDEPWNVYWPPKDTDSLSAKSRIAIDTVVEELQLLVVRSGLVRLAYAAARTSELFTEIGEQTALRGTGVEENELEGMPLGSMALQIRLRELASQEEMTGDDPYWDGALWNRVRKYNNALSLVVSNCTGTFLNFGDCEGASLNKLLQLGICPGLTPHDTIRPLVLLAPHHGTQKPGKTFESLFPDANDIVLQNGVQHSQKLRSKRLFYNTKSSNSVLETYGPVFTNPLCTHFFQNL